MYTALFTTKFKRDLKRQKKRGKARHKIDDMLRVICQEGDAPLQNRPHNLSGNYAGWRECHIEPDWLLLYRVDDTHVIFSRTGTHADLFD